MIVVLMGLQKTPQQIFSAVDMLTDSLLLLDFVLCFFKSYYDSEGDQIILLSKIASYYFLSVRFFLDILALLPFWCLALYYPLLLPLRVLKLIQFKKIHRISKNTNLIANHKHLLKIILMLCALLVFILCSTSLWVFLTRIKGNWLTLVEQINPKAPHNFQFCEDKTPLQQFLTSLVYVCMMVISEAEGFPFSEIQLVLACIVLFIGSFIDAILFGFIITHINGINKKQKLLNSKFDTIRTTMKDMKFDPSFQRSMFHAVTGPIVTAMNKEEMDRFLIMLSPSLHKKVITHVCHEALKACPLLYRLFSFYNIDSSLELVMKSPDEIIFNYGDQSDGIYFIVSGGVGLYTPSLTRPCFKYIGSLNVGCYFGEIGIAFNSTRTLAVNSRARYSTLAFMKKEILDEYVRFEPLLAEVFYRKIDGYNDRSCNQIYKRLKRSKIFPYPILQLFKKELFKFKIMSFQPGQYLWKAKERIKGIMVILAGQASFCIKAQKYLIPLEIALPGQVVGLDHCITEYIQTMTYLRAQSYMKVAFYEVKSFNCKGC